MEEKNKDMSRLKIIIRLFRMIKPVRGRMLFAILFGILNHLSNIAVITWGAYLISSFLIPEAATPGALSISLLFVFAIMKAVCSFVEQLANHDVAFRLLAHLRTGFFKQIERLVPAKLMNKRSGDVVSRVGGDVEIIEVFFAHTISPFAIAFAVSTAFLIFLGMWWWVLPLVMLPLHIFLGILLPFGWEKYVRKTGQDIRSTLGETNAYITDSLQGLETILLYNQGQNRKNEIAAKSDRLKQIKSGHTSRQGWLLGSVNGTIMFANALTLLVAVAGLRAGHLDLQGMIIVTASSISAFVPLFYVSVLSHYLTESFAAAERLFNIIDEKPAVVDLPEATAVMPVRFDIDFNNVTFRYNADGPEVLDSFNLHIPQGNCIAIVGESGCGKSTVLNLLLRFWEFGSGKITIGGKNIKNIRQKSLPDIISVVSPDSHLFDTTIRENIAIGKPEATIDEIIASAKKASIHDFIMTLPDGYETRIGELGDNLSGGERQRLAISRILLKDTPILLFDEPTSNLDSYNENAIQETLNRISKDKTVIIVTHRLSLLAGVDNAYRLNSGRLSEFSFENTMVA